MLKKIDEYKLKERYRNRETKKDIQEKLMYRKIDAEVVTFEAV